GRAPLPAMMPSGPPLSAIRAFWLTDRARRVGPDKGDDVVDRADAAEALGHFCDPVVESAVGREQKLIGAAQGLDVLATEAAAVHADDVEPTEAGAVAHDLAIGNDVALDTGHTANHRMLPDPHELVHRREAAQEGIILDDHMAGQSRVVRHDDMVANLAIMCDVGADHEQPVLANAGHHAAAFGAGIHRHVFADRVVTADHETRFLAAVFQILGLEADRGEGEDARLFADRCAPVDDDMRDEGDSRPEHDLPTD